MSLYIKYTGSLSGGSGGGGVTTVGPIDTATPSVNGAVISGSIITFQSASPTDPGMVNDTTQSFAGAKTFSTPITLSSLTTPGVLLNNSSGIVSSSAGPLAITNGGTGTATTSANFVFSGPTSGGSAAPSFRLLTSSDIPSLSAIYVLQSEVGAANGVASLDSGGKVPVGQLPATVMEYQGNWNPNTNTPTLSDGTGTNGNIYWVSAARLSAVSGLNNPSMVNFQVGDLVLYSSALGQWQLTTPAAGVQSVNGAQGAVIVNAINQLTGDITAGPASESQSVSASLVATSNSTLTTLSSLSLPGSQVTGNISGNAANITASSNSTLVTLSALSLSSSQVTGSIPGSQISGNISGDAGNVTGTVAIANGGTGQTSASAAFNALSPITATGDLIVGNGTNSSTNLPIGSTGEVLTVAGGTAAWAPAPSPTFIGAKARGQTGGFTVSNATNVVVNNYDMVDYDTGTNFDNSTGIFTASIAGYYLISWSFIFTGNPTGIRYSVCQKNGTDDFYGTDSNSPGSGGFSVHGSGPVFLNIGDTIQIAVFQTSGGNLTLDSSETASQMVSFSKL